MWALRSGRDLLWSNSKKRSPTLSASLRGTTSTPPCVITGRRVDQWLGNVDALVPKGRICHFVKWQIPPFGTKATMCVRVGLGHIVRQGIGNEMSV